MFVAAELSTASKGRVAVRMNAHAQKIAVMFFIWFCVANI
jgi:hypothetical protein